MRNSVRRESAWQSAAARRRKLTKQVGICMNFDAFGRLECLFHARTWCTRADKRHALAYMGRGRSFRRSGLVRWCVREATASHSRLFPGQLKIQQNFRYHTRKHGTSESAVRVGPRESAVLLWNGWLDLDSPLSSPLRLSTVRCLWACMLLLDSDYLYWFLL